MFFFFLKASWFLSFPAARRRRSVSLPGGFGRHRARLDHPANRPHEPAQLPPQRRRRHWRLLTAAPLGSRTVWGGSCATLAAGARPSTLRSAATEDRRRRSLNSLGECEGSHRKRRKLNAFRPPALSALFSLLNSQCGHDYILAVKKQKQKRSKRNEH